jgi:hypothetical protein
MRCFRDSSSTDPCGSPVGSRPGRRRVVWLGALLPILLFALGVAVPLASPASASWWVPTPGSTWQWQLSTPVDQSVDAQVYDIDLFENSASVVSSLHAQGRHVVCSLDAGTWEGWRPDASKFPASVLGSADPGWTDERWLDIRQLSVLEPIMQARLQMCKEKGFDGVEVDNVDGYANNTGFPLTAANQLAYNEWLASAAHALGLSIALKNDTGQIAQLEPYFDFALDEECFDYSECNQLTPFVAAGKAVFEVEYSLQPSQFCSQANALGFMAMKKDLSLDAWNAPCWSQGDWVGAKGSAGYDLAAWNGSGDVGYMLGATITLAKGSRYEWGANTTDTRALQGPNGSARNAATYYDPNQIQVDVHFSSAYQGNLHLYAVDWDSTARRETIAVGGQTANLSGSFNQGSWISFPINVAAGATLPISVIRTAGANAVLSGIFLGDAGSPPVFASSAPQGSWVGTYGSKGYALAGWNGSTDLSSLPNTSLNLVQGSRYRWAPATTDVRALQSPGKSTRVAATYYDPNQVVVKLSFTSAYSGSLELYALDWDSTARRETISVNGQVAGLSSSFNQGIWLSIPIDIAAGGTATITVDRIAGSNAVLSGIFLE